jgi:hypothetical protein
MAGVERLELPTIGFGDRCSTNWNYTPIFYSTINQRLVAALVLCIFFYVELRETREVRRNYTNQNILFKGYFTDLHIIRASALQTGLLAV